MSSVSKHSDQSVTSTEYSEMMAVQAFGRALVKREQFRSGGCIETAIASVAARIKTAPGALSNIVKNRVKDVRFKIAQRIISAGLTDIENERKQLDHEHEIMLAMAVPEDANDLVALEALLQEAHAVAARIRGRR